MNFKILERKILKNIPGASGLVNAGNFFYVLGDNSPFLFKLDAELQEIDRIELLQGEQREQIPKPEKMDLEALEKITENELLAFGSGSLSPQRDVMLRILLEEKPVIEHFSLSSFYSSLKGLKIMQNSELNIEAAAFLEGQLLLFNRRKNVIFSLPSCEFLAAVKNNAVFPEAKATAVQLPEINGIEAGFTGATFTNSGRLVVTAAVEDTDNAYDDGEVLGSFIGISTGVKNGFSEKFLWAALPLEEPLKIESICVLKETSDEILLALVTDSDGAESLFLKVILQL